VNSLKTGNISFFVYGYPPQMKDYKDDGGAALTKLLEKKKGFDANMEAKILKLEDPSAKITQVVSTIKEGAEKAQAELVAKKESACCEIF